MFMPVIDCADVYSTPCKWVNVIKRGSGKKIVSTHRLCVSDRHNSMNCLPIKRPMMIFSLFAFVVVVVVAAAAFCPLAYRTIKFKRNCSYGLSPTTFMWCNWNKRTNTLFSSSTGKHILCSSDTLSLQTWFEKFVEDFLNILRMIPNKFELMSSTELLG